MAMGKEVLFPEHVEGVRVPVTGEVASRRHRVAALWSSLAVNPGFDLARFDRRLPPPLPLYYISTRKYLHMYLLSPRGTPGFFSTPRFLLRMENGNQLPRGKK